MGQEREGLPSTGGEGRKKQYKERKNHINTNVELDIAAESNQKRKKKKKSQQGEKWHSEEPRWQMMGHERSKACRAENLPQKSLKD